MYFLRCDDCGNSYRSQSGLNGHRRKKHAPKEKKQSYTCSVCMKRLTTKSGFLNHMRKKHDEKTPAEITDNKYRDFMMETFDMNCDLCATTFQSFFDARSHYKDVHNDDKGYVKCCGLIFRQFSFVIDHINVHFNPATFKWV